MVVEEYDDEVTKAIDRAYAKLAKKNQRKNSGQQLSFGIEKVCSSTGLPAKGSILNLMEEPVYKL